MRAGIFPGPQVSSVVRLFECPEGFFMRYKSVGIAAAALVYGAVCAGAAVLETRAGAAGSGLSADHKLESTVGEISYSTDAMKADGKILRGGHSGASHSPGTVYDLTASTISLTEAQFRWNNGSSEGDTSVEIKVATFSITQANYGSVASYLVQAAGEFMIAEQHLYSGLSSGTTYYLALRVRDASGIYGRVSTATFNTAPIKPRAPVITGQTSGSQFVISWPAVQYNTSGGAVTVASYEIYHSTALSGAVVSDGSISTTTWSVTPSGLWYFVKAVDSNGVSSDASIWLSDSDDVQRVVGDDDRAVVDMPPYVEEFLETAGLVPVLENQPQYETGATVVSYKFYLRDSAQNEVSRLLERNVTLTMPTSRTGSVNITGLPPSVSYSDYDYAVFFYNGVEDVNIGGTVDPESGTVSVDTRRTGVYKVKRVIRAQGFTKPRTVPVKIFTPNGDGVNDMFNILGENPAQLALGSAKVFDLSGAEIASLQTSTEYPPTGTNYALAWDGRRSNGDKAPSGIYIYQFKAGDKFYNGTMVLAR